jgi:phosphohistidine phosphatase
MKRVIFMRHAKAEPMDDEMTDFDRQLAEKGRNDAGIISSVLQNNGIKPDLILSSSALRAYQTALIISERIGLNPGKVKKHDDLYEDVTTSDILEYITTSVDSVKTLMIVGHNPWISNVAVALSQNFDEIFPTSGLLVLDFKVDFWDEVIPGDGKTRLYDFPKNYRN